MKIAIGQVSHETNTFSSVSTELDAFKRRQWSSGQKLLDEYTGVRDYLGGMIDAAREAGVELIPTFAASAYPSGVITRDASWHLIRTLSGAISERAQEIDALCLSLHGAGVTEDTDDFEYETLRAVREVIGYEIPIVATLDLHANLTAEMLGEADAFLGVKLYPHVDSYTRGRDALELAVHIAEGAVQPTMRAIKLPFMMPLSTTNHPPVSEINALCSSEETRAGVIDCTLLHGFPYADVSGVGSAVVAITDNDEALADEVSGRIANEVWNLRDDLVNEFPSPAEGVRLAMRSQHTPVVINETSDNPGGGSPGDGTRLLKAMLDLRPGPGRACFAIVNDPEVTQEAHNAGAGQEIEVSLGGKTDDLHGDPLKVEAYVKCLTDGTFVQSSPMSRGRRVDIGPSARLQISGIDVLVGSANVQVLDEQMFALHGIDVTQCDLVALKSSHHFRAVFEDLAAEIITVDAPGLSTSNLEFFDFVRIPRPVYPLDDVTEPILGRL